MTQRFLKVSERQWSKTGVQTARLMTIILHVQHTENETSPKSVIFKQLRLPKDMKFYLKYGLNLNFLLTYVAETKVILREMYSILIGNDSLLKRPQVI